MDYQSTVVILQASRQNSIQYNSLSDTESMQIIVK